MLKRVLAVVTISLFLSACGDNAVTVNPPPVVSVPHSPNPFSPPPQQTTCPSGDSGTPPNCVAPAPPPSCPTGDTGTPPNCVAPPPPTCPTGDTGTPPNCVAPPPPPPPTPTVGYVTVSWTPPTENTDNTPCTNLAGYYIHYGTSPSSMTNVVKLSNPGLTMYMFDNLTYGQVYYFYITAYNSDGGVSPPSSIVSDMADDQNN